HIVLHRKNNVIRLLRRPGSSGNLGDTIYGVPLLFIIVRQTQEFFAPRLVHTHTHQRNRPLLHWKLVNGDCSCQREAVVCKMVPLVLPLLAHRPLRSSANATKPETIGNFGPFHHKCVHTTVHIPPVRFVILAGEESHKSSRRECRVAFTLLRWDHRCSGGANTRKVFILIFLRVQHGLHQLQLVFKV
ncbi:uncharacterized protein TM35_002591000, partial [Trypanosoma theileri]